MVKAGLIHTDSKQLSVDATVDIHGSVYCHLKGGTTFEKSVFINSLQEIVGPIDNPRYVIVRKSRFMLLLKQRDYHSVPDVIGKTKKLAMDFKNQWDDHVGSSDLIYTRTIEGRKLLLKSRIESLSSQFVDEIERVNKWR